MIQSCLLPFIRKPKYFVGLLLGCTKVTCPHFLLSFIKPKLMISFLFLLSFWEFWVFFEAV